MPRKPKPKPRITIRYWRGTIQHEDTATGYAGAMRIARYNQNTFPPTFHDPEGKRLYDLGACLAYEPDAEGKVIVYA